MKTFSFSAALDTFYDDLVSQPPDITTRAEAFVLGEVISDRGI